jgi:hypothetical protein
MNRDDMLRASLRQLPVPDVSPDLLHRIVRSRVMGVRTSLHGRRWSVPWGRIAAAAFILAFLTGSWKLSLTFSRMGQSRLNRDRVKEFLRTTIPWASSGDEGRALSDKPPAPKYPLISVDSLDLSRLTEGTWTYRSSVTTDEVLTAPAGHSRIHLARVTFQSRAMWILMMAHSRDSASWGPYGDTTYLDPESLRPQRSIYYYNKNRTVVVQSFSADSATESLDFSGPIRQSYRESIALPFSRETFFVNGWPLDRVGALLPAFPLKRGWQGSLYQVALVSRIGVRGVSPMDLWVVGRERVTVPAGTFDCWRLQVVTYFGQEDQRQTVWVSRDKGWVIKVQADNSSDVMSTRELESYEPGS